jgi:hypothetical protein
MIGTVISRLPCLPLEIVLGSGDVLLNEVGDMLAVVSLIIAGCDRDSLGLLLQSPLVTLGAPLFALICCLRGRPSTTARSFFPIALYENSPDHLFARGVPAGDVEELLHGLWLIASELMHQCSTVHAGPER